MDKTRGCCPICDQEHELNLVEEKTTTLIKGELIEHMAKVVICPVTQDRFASAKVVAQNILNAKDEYRKKHNLLTSKEIIKIREKYSLTQKELSNILGWGDITIQRYEKKSIQDETYDNILRRVNDEPLFLLEQLEIHKDKVGESYDELLDKIKSEVNSLSSDYYIRREIKSKYINYHEKSIVNGYKELDLNKFENIVAYLSNYIKPLYKVKLMKLLWYTDMINYKEYGQSMTGLVYAHLPYGAVPLSYEELLKLDSVYIEEEYKEEYVGYKVHSKKNCEIGVFSNEEVAILTRIVDKFKDMSTREIVDYMHQEEAYKKTMNNEVISYEFVNTLNEFNIK